jgi:hypothetical protein
MMMGWEEGGETAFSASEFTNSTKSPEASIIFNFIIPKYNFLSYFTRSYCPQPYRDLGLSR